MYAIVQVGGRQYRAVAGERLVVDRLDVEPGSRVHLSDVRMLVAEDGDGTETEIGRPRVADVAVAARAVSHFRGPKILVFKYKPKKRYRRHQGFRAELTELRIEEVRRGAYEDKPQAEPAKRRTQSQTARAASAKGTKVVPDLDQVAELADEPVKAPAPVRSRVARTAKPSATSPSTRETAAVEKPKAPRAPRKPVAGATTPPTETKTKRTRTKPADKQEQVDGS